MFPHPFIVLDLNQLRDTASLARALGDARQLGLRLLIPDGAFFEMSQSGKPFETWRRSLELLAPHRDLVVVSDKLTHLMRNEAATGIATVALVQEQTIAFLRDLLTELKSSDFATLTRLIDGPVKADKVGSAAWSQHDAIKQLIQNLHDRMKSELTEHEMSLMRKHPETALAEWLLSKRGLQFGFQGIRTRLESDRVAVDLLLSPNVLSGFYSAIVGIALDWCAFGGLASASSKSIANDLHDTEFVVLGALCHSFRSKDTRASRLSQAVGLAFQHRGSRLAEFMDMGSVESPRL